MSARIPEETTSVAAPSTQPGAKAPNYSWIGWGLAGLTVAWGVAVSGLAQLSMGPLVAASAILLLLAAAVVRPRSSDPVRRRLWWLLLLPVCWILALLFGPLGLVPVSADPARIQWMLRVQNIAFGASIVLVLALLWPMRGARRLTLALGALNALAALLVLSVNTVIIAPGS